MEAGSFAGLEMWLKHNASTNRSDCRPNHSISISEIRRERHIIQGWPSPSFSNHERSPASNLCLLFSVSRRGECFVIWDVLGRRLGR